MKEIAMKVAKYYGITYTEIKAKTRLRKIVRPRQMAMLLIMENTKTATFAKTGAIFNKDHATVIHALKSMRNDISNYDDVAKEYMELNHIIFGGFKPKNKYYNYNHPVICYPCVNHVLNPQQIINEAGK